MKKLLVTLLTTAMVASLAACGGNSNTVESTESVSTETTAIESTESTVETESAATTESTPAATGETIGQTVLAKYNELIAANPEATAQEIVDGIVSAEILPFMPASAPVEPGFLMGFSADITGFEEAVQFSPMIGTIPFMGFIFTLADDADVDAFVETLKTNANPAWNICTQADETFVQADGTTVFFLMSPVVLE